MKRIYRLSLNLFAMALLAFSLYLNFVKRDASGISMPNEVAKAAPTVSNAKQAQQKTAVKTDTQVAVASK